MCGFSIYLNMNLFSHLVKARNFGKCIVWNTWQPERCFQTSQRSLKQILTKTLRIKHEDFYKRMDKIPLEYEMIYKFPLHYTMNFGKAVAIITTVGLPCALLYYRLGNVEHEIINFVGLTAASQDDLVYFVAGLIAFNMVIFRVCNMIALRIYRYQKSYVAITPGIVPRFNNRLNFKEGDVREHFKALSLWRELTYKVNGKNMMLVPARFRKSNDLFDMLNKADAKKYK